MNHRSIKLLPALLAMASLTGCISFGATPPPMLLTLTAATPLTPGQTSNSASAATITIQLPSVPAAIATVRVPVQTSPTSIAYVKDAQWSEPPARLFARLLADTIGAKTGRVVLTPAQSFYDPGARLGGELRNFGVDAMTGDAVVTYDATLSRSDAKVFEKRIFEAREPIGTVTPQSTSEGLNRAANRIASEVADWVGK
ncbi:ABC-type transport auxiliary lipoprotein family protein [Sphingomonas sp. 28-63-12]|uniref:ABC-type transport auxiliary lipoprotein family protein n=1 Tax=Sphingomonas sp. 28-63-12 TaxID=1970434 RepID=UPI000BD03C0C|nr:MAG: ABC transporter [Sphingomonas sp. 28-63-12]